MEQLLINILKKSSESYYNSGELYELNDEEFNIVKDIIDIKTNIIEDSIYDLLYDKLKTDYPFNPYFKTIGAEIDEDAYGKEIIFDNPAGSLCELKSGDWDKWKINTSYVISNKLDGCSVVLFYENGLLVKAASRGNGYKGKDITRHIMKIKSIPKQIQFNDNIEIRGEMICPLNEINLMIFDLKDETGREYKNGRNTISGFINSKNTLKSVVNHVHFVAFNTHYENQTDDKFEEFEFMKSLGFEVPIYRLINENISEDLLISFVKDAKNSNYECDGIVIDQKNTQINFEGFESGTINPKRSRKFKIGATNNIAETTVNNIIWEISKDGYFKPVVEIEPVELVGVTVVKATGHNYKNIIDNKIGIGSKIKIKRSGDVIPYIQEVLTESNEYNLPTVETIIDGVELQLKDLESINEYTIEMNIKKIATFCGIFGIDFMGYGNCKKIYEYIKTPFELLFLDESIFIEAFGVNGSKAYKSLHEKIKNISESRLFASLSTFGRGISVSMLEKIEEKWNTLDVSQKQLENTDGFGIIRIPQYMENLYLYKEQKTKFLEKYKFAKKSIIEIKSDKFADYNVCFTGVRSKELVKIINENGGKASDSWSKNVNLLVTKDLSSNSGKIKNAIKNNIKIITIEEAEKLFTMEYSEDIF